MNTDRKHTVKILNALVLAGEAILEIYRSDDFKTELKSDNSPVTLADKMSSSILISELNNLFPETRILCEENPIPSFEERKKWDNFFMIDPLDGTKEFINKNGEFCINLALIEYNNPTEGWIYSPVNKKGWYAKKGHGIFEFDCSLNLIPIEIHTEKPNKLRIVISRSFYNRNEAELIARIKENYPVEVIQLGSSLKQIAILNNQADLYIKAGPCSEWDTAPGQLMIEESGGAVLLSETFEKMRYNKPVLQNPHFIMVGAACNNSDFISFLKGVIHNSLLIS